VNQSVLVYLLNMLKDDDEYLLPEIMINLRVWSQFQGRGCSVARIGAEVATFLAA
jgi:hypothetical protein